MSRAIEEVAVVLSGDQTVGGIKTFTSSPIAPTPVSGDNSTKVATTAFVNTKLSATVQTTGDQTVAGTKTFSDGLAAPTVVNTDNSTKVATTAHVKDYVTNKAIKPTNFADAPATLSTNYVLVWDSVSAEYRKTTIASIASGGVTLAPVATSGVYSDLTGRPTLGALSALDATSLSGFLQGLTLSYGSTTTFSVATGEAVSEDGSGKLMVLSSPLTKSLSAFATGSGNGGLSTGTITANTWYHVHVVQRVSDGLVDAILDLSPTAPTMPTTGGTWTARRRIGAIKTNASSQLVQFTQHGDEFILNAYPIDVSTTSLSNVATLYTLSVPTGIQVIAVFSAYMDARATNACGVLVSSPDQLDVAAGNPSGTPTSPFNAGNAGTGPLTVSLRIRTNTSGQVRARSGIASNANLFMIQTMGWVDTRGR